MQPLFAALALWFLGAVVRLREIHNVVVSSDSLGPYLKAWSLSWDWLPRPPNPESGDALWLLSWPLVQLSSSLVELMELRMIWGAVVGPAAFAAVWGFLPQDGRRAQRWVAALTAGLLTAMDPGLVDTLMSGARSYGAPELVGLATATGAWALRGHRWAAIASAGLLVMAIDHHPLAAGMGLGVLTWGFALRGTLSRKTLGLAAIAAAVLALPRLIRTGAQALCGEGPLNCLAGIAKSNVTGEVDVMAVLTVALHDRFAVDLGWAWPVLTLGVVLALCRYQTRLAGSWAVGGLIGLLLLGTAVGYVRPYHLRILAVPIAVAAALGLARWWPVAMALGIGIGIWGWKERPVGPDPGALARADQIAAHIIQLDGPLWVDQIWWDGPPKVDSAAVVLSAVLSGADPDQFQLSPDATMVLLSTEGPPAPRAPRLKGDGWRVHLAPSPAAARAWLKRQDQVPHQVGGALDWASALHPHSARADQAQWWLTPIPE